LGLVLKRFFLGVSESKEIENSQFFGGSLIVCSKHFLAPPVDRSFNAIDDDKRKTDCQQ
jgi:hypothetical protein